MSTQTSSKQDSSQTEGEEARPFTVRMGLELYERLRAYAFASRLSMNAIVSNALAAYLREHRSDELKANMDRFIRENQKLFENLRNDDRVRR